MKGSIVFSSRQNQRRSTGGGRRVRDSQGQGQVYDSGAKRNRTDVVTHCTEYNGCLLSPLRDLQCPQSFRRQFLSIVVHRTYIERGWKRRRGREREEEAVRTASA